MTKQQVNSMGTWTLYPIQLRLLLKKFNALRDNTTKQSNAPNFSVPETSEGLGAFHSKLILSPFFQLFFNFRVPGHI